MREGQGSRRVDPLTVHAMTLGAFFFAAAAAPTPLYRIYQETLALSPVFVTLVFAVYAVALLKALSSPARSPTISGAAR